MGKHDHPQPGGFGAGHIQPHHQTRRPDADFRRSGWRPSPGLRDPAAERQHGRVAGSRHTCTTGGVHLLRPLTMAQRHLLSRPLLRQRQQRAVQCLGHGWRRQSGDHHPSADRRFGIRRHSGGPERPCAGENRLAGDGHGFPALVHPHPSLGGLSGWRASGGGHADRFV
ncbi:MAG: hypothetical protein BWY83_01761 [bacterium ADurb.Bin478]|nr:MAG: hypothetical protein BWY83_01761 [bacterium ADurb.Bin478]